MPRPKYTVKILHSTSDAQPYYWTLSARNGKILATSELYKNRAACCRMAEQIADGLGAKLVDTVTPVQHIDNGDEGHTPKVRPSAIARLQDITRKPGGSLLHKRETGLGNRDHRAKARRPLGGIHRSNE
jgi:uncharacterized protein YegP (UPF0339 family)